MHKEFRGSGGAFEFIRPFLVMMGMGAMSKMIAGQELIRENSLITKESGMVRLGREMPSKY